jgi:chromosomal replication initiation ATPase DnaA
LEEASQTHFEDMALSEPVKEVLQRVVEMSAYSRPGIGLTKGFVIDMVTRIFNLKNKSWVIYRSRKPEYVIPRQVLITCLIDYLNFSVTDAAAVCGKDHSTGTHSHKVTHETLVNDREYGERVRRVFGECRKILDASKHL